MSNNTHDNIPIEEINKKTPRPPCDWDQLEQEHKKGKKNESTSTTSKRASRSRNA